MKTLLIFFAIISILPAHALCPLEDGATVCTLPGFREQLEPTYSQKTNISEFAETPEVRLNPINRDNLQEQTREFAPVESNFNYNSSCQFGVCMQNRAKPLFQQKSK